MFFINITLLPQFFKCDADDEYGFPDDYTTTLEMLEELLEFEMRATSDFGLWYVPFKGSWIATYRYYHVIPSKHVNYAVPH